MTQSTQSATCAPRAIRDLTARDVDAVLAMMRVFYASPAVLSNGSEEIFRRDLEFCVGDSPLLHGYVFETTAGELAGYGMVSPGFSTERGGPCLWIEDLYVRPEFRRQGLGQAFFRFLEERWPEVRIFKLEVETANECAARLYRKCGYDILPYGIMKKARG